MPRLSKNLIQDFGPRSILFHLATFLLDARCIAPEVALLFLKTSGPDKLSWYSIAPVFCSVNKLRSLQTLLFAIAVDRHTQLHSELLEIPSSFDGQ